MRGLFSGTVYHAFLIPVVVLVAGGLVALAMLPAVASAGRAVKAADKTLLGDTNPLIIPTFPLRSTIYAADGTVLATLFQDENREYLTLDQVAPIAQDAVISVEDHNFYKHGPVDFTSILRAALANLKAGKVVQGGSTITQQLVKNTEVGAADTFKRKFQEAQLAFRLERQRTARRGDRLHGASRAREHQRRSQSPSRDAAAVRGDRSPRRSLVRVRVDHRR